MPINDGKYVVPAWQDGGPPAIDAAELTAIGQSIVTNQNGVTQNTQNVSTLQQQMSTANQDIASLQQFQTTATGQIANLTNNYLPKSGGTMTGPITLPGNPSGALQAVPKQYADARGWTLVNTLFSNISGNIGDGPIYSNKLMLGNIDNFTELKIETSLNITCQSQPHGFGLYIYSEAGSSEILIPDSVLENFMDYQYADRLYVLTYPYTFSGKYSVLLQKSAFGISTYNASTFKIAPVFSVTVPCGRRDISSPTVKNAPEGVCSGCNIYLEATSDVSNEQQVSGNVTFNVYGR